jgi:enoyl-CoA hydratase/carnithine racemase
VGFVTRSVDARGIATLTLNDEGNLNAMSEEMAHEFSAAVAALKSDATLRAVILTGAGKAFSAGGHLAMLEAKRAKSGEANRVAMQAFYDAFLCILDLKVPLIAALNGAAIGAGLCLACACDVRVASTDAKLGFTFLKLGLHPGMGATFLVPRIVGRSMATELLLTSRVIDASEALRIRLLSRVCPRDAVVQEAHNIAHEMLACGPAASAQLLETMRGDMSELKNALNREALCQSINYAGAEFAEGLAAVKEKRLPNFPKA